MRALSKRARDSVVQKGGDRTRVPREARAVTADRPGSLASVNMEYSTLGEALLRCKEVAKNAVARNAAGLDQRKVSGFNVWPAQTVLRGGAPGETLTGRTRSGTDKQPKSLREQEPQIVQRQALREALLPEDIFRHRRFLLLKQTYFLLDTLARQ